ncbi:hypothetical protein ILYODFUR_004628 [Ilyodon furcidens]|uniref:Uncharacterized protein n=1 Tax=Ilyodon furcidens TaxID=33524 RepID=A0ABV0U6Y8_9TELE
MGVLGTTGDPQSWVLGSTGCLSAWSLHVLPVHAWVLSGYSSFLPQSKNMIDSCISKFPLGVNARVFRVCPVFLCVSLQRTGNLSRVYPWTAGDCYQLPVDPVWKKWV